jgi:hypothetical protein
LAGPVADLARLLEGEPHAVPPVGKELEPDRDACLLTGLGEQLRVNAPGTYPSTKEING